MRCAAEEVAGRPAVVGWAGGVVCRAGVCIGIELKEGVFRRVVAQVIGTHVRGEERSAIYLRDVVKVYGIAKSLGNDVLIRAVRIHDGKRRADTLLL